MHKTHAMTDGLMINGQNAYETYGIMMGDGFLDALLAPVPLKPFVSNKSRLTHGRRMVLPAPSYIKKDERSLTLIFVIMGDTPALMLAHKAAFYNLLYSGKINISFDLEGSYVPTEDEFRLFYDGTSVSYGEDITHTACKVSVKFNEVNPDDRENEYIEEEG